MSTAAGLGWIYALLEPDANEIRYVGQTYSHGGPQGRLTRHIRIAGYKSRQEQPSHLTRWLLKLSDKRPRVEVLAILPVDQLNVAEQQWILYLREIGCDLVNTAPGGTGGPTRTGMKTPRATVEKQRAASIGRRLSASARASISAARHNDLPVACQFCGNPVKGAANMAQHRARHAAMYRTLMSRSAQHQAIAQLRRDVRAAAPSSCVACKKTFADRRRRSNHLRMKHGLDVLQTT